VTTVQSPVQAAVFVPKPRDEQSIWVGTPSYNPLLLLLAPPSDPLILPAPQPNVAVGADLWQGSPDSAATMILQAQQAAPEFAPPTQFNYVPDPVWQGEPQSAQSLILPIPPIPPFTREIVLIARGPLWVPKPPKPEDWVFISPVALASAIPQPEPFSIQWRYDFEPDKFWQGNPNSAYSLTMLARRPFFKLWRWDYEPDKFWQGAPIQTNIEFFPFTEPFSKLWRYDEDSDVRQWTGSPISAATLQGLAVIGQPKQKFWRYDFASGETYWQGSPIPTNTETLPVTNPFHRQWRWDHDQPAYWQGAPTQYNAEIATRITPFFRLWRYDLDQTTFWQGTPTQDLALLNITPFKPKWQFNIAEETYWRAELRRNLPIQKAPPVGFQMDASLTIREDTYWLEPQHRNIVIGSLTPKLPPAYTWSYYATDPYWQGKPIAYPTVYYRAVIVVVDPDLVIPSFPIIPGRKDPLVWFGDDLRKSPIPDDPLIPGRKDVLIYVGEKRKDPLPDPFWPGRKDPIGN